MNYFEIVLQGYFNENNREFLDKYFLREYKKAEKEQFFEVDEFFNGCLKVIEAFKNNLQNQINEQQHLLNQYLIQDGEKNIDFIKAFKEQIEFQRLNGNTNFRLKNGTILHLKKNEINYIETAINRAYENISPPPPNTKQKPEQETPKTFAELFYNTDLVTPCIDILKELDPPLIDTDCNYIGKLKGVFCVWIDEMQRQGIVKSNFPEERKLFASLIPQKIKRFSIDESMFGKHQSKAENLYRTDIKTKVSKIKLSQNSH